MHCHICVSLFHEEKVAWSECWAWQNVFWNILLLCWYLWIHKFYFLFPKYLCIFYIKRKTTYFQLLNQLAHYRLVLQWGNSIEHFFHSSIYLYCFFFQNKQFEICSDTAVFKNMIRIQIASEWEWWHNSELTVPKLFEYAFCAGTLKMTN